jgi:hypothetical protein
LAGNIFREVVDVCDHAVPRLPSSDIQARIGAGPMGCSAIDVYAAAEYSANGMPAQKSQPDPKRESRHFSILGQHYSFDNSCIGISFS